MNSVTLALCGQIKKLLDEYFSGYIGAKRLQIVTETLLDYFHIIWKSIHPVCISSPLSVSIKTQKRM